MSFLFPPSRPSPFSNNKTYLHPIITSTPPSQSQLVQQLVFKKQLPIYAPTLSLTRPPPAILSSRDGPPPFISSMNPTTTFSLTAVGFLSPKIKCLSENKKESYSFQSKSDAGTRNMTFKDINGNLVCKVKSKGEHLLDLHLTTDSKDINVQFRDMIAFKKAVEKNAQGGSLRMPPIFQPGDEDDERADPRYIAEINSAGMQQTCWAFEFEGRIYQWTAPSGHSIHALPGSVVLVCHSTSSGPAAKVAKVSSSHTGASDKLTISNASTANVIDKNGLQILLLVSVLSLMEIINDRSRDLVDFE